MKTDCLQRWAERKIKRWKSYNQVKRGKPLLLQQFWIDRRKQLLENHCYAFWLAKKSRASFSTNYKRNKTKANYTLYVRFFPRFEQVTVNFSESDWLNALFSPGVITGSRSRWAGACNSHTKPVTAFSQTNLFLVPFSSVKERQVRSSDAVTSISVLWLIGHGTPTGVSFKVIRSKNKLVYENAVTEI